MNQSTNGVVRSDEGRAKAERARHRRVVAPDVDVFENADEVLVVADVPGVRAEAVDIRVENDTLTIEARQDRSQGEAPALGREFEPLDYARAFRIPAGIDGANVRAEAKGGTVVVHLPKAAAAKPRKISVQTS
jgi:HSP20 family molecular chaperone IbpA